MIPSQRGDGIRWKIPHQEAVASSVAAAPYASCAVSHDMLAGASHPQPKRNETSTDHYASTNKCI